MCVRKCIVQKTISGCVLVRFVGCFVFYVLCVVGCVLVRFVGPNVNQSKLYGALLLS